jgi:hypothetical protein
MANIAIQIKVGSHPDKYEKGVEYYFSVGSEDSKISSEEIIRFLTETIDNKLFEKYGVPQNPR